MSLQRSTIGVSRALLQFPWPRVPTSNAKVSSWLRPLLHLVDQVRFYIFPHTTEQDSQAIAALISKHVVPYWTRGGTCCPKVSTPKIRSLADLSMTNHISRWKPSVSTIPTHAQTTTSILTMVTSHHDGWKTKTLKSNISQTQHHKDGKTYMTVMTAGLSKSDQTQIPILKVSSRYSS
jgi:hypothetical protein